MNLPWLYEHRYNHFSQHGEDGVVEAILSRIGEDTRWCVDIGANDGVTISNSHYWCGSQGWSGVLVESDKNTWQRLRDVYADRNDVTCLQEFVGAGNSIDAILERCGVPQRFDILSIDIDGMDFWLWQAMERYRPRIVVIEVNASMGPDVHMIQQDPKLNLGSSALAMVGLARDKGYELAAHLVSNCIFVDSEEFALLGIQENSISELFTSPFVPVVVSDLEGVHYILKPGPWGFSGARVTPGMSASEGGDILARRLLICGRGSGGSVLTVDPDSSAGYSAAVLQAPELRRVAKRFSTLDWSMERESLQGGNVAPMIAQAE